MMKLVLIFIINFALIIVVTSQRNPDNQTSCCTPGYKGEKGIPGAPGPGGRYKGEKGYAGKIRYLGQPSYCSQLEDSCPQGRGGYPGYDGDKGAPGSDGRPGPIGFQGPDGPSGIIGVPGPPGPSSDNVLFLPYTTSSSNICYSFLRYCYVPGLSNGWRAWNRKGQSGYLVYNSWMFFVTLSKCPCKYRPPPLPQPVQCHSGDCT